jgi:hypothetical protein
MAGDDTETELRHALKAAIAERDARRATAQAAKDACDRAEANQQRARATLNSFEHLDGQIDAYTADALRKGESGELSPTLFEQVAERQRALVGFTAAQNALGVLQGELHAAIRHCEEADAVVKKALRDATRPERQRLRELGRRMQAKGAATVQVAGWSDDAEPWRGLCDGLLDDPMNASVTVPDDVIPAEPRPEEPPRPPVFIQGSTMITVMHPDRPPERITQAEHARREREARIKASSGATTEAMAIEEAKMRVRRLTA